MAAVFAAGMAAAQTPPPSPSGGAHPPAAVLPRAAAPPGQTGSSSAANELRTARLMARSLDARKADGSEWRKLEKVYADLDFRYPGNPAVKNGWGECLWDHGDTRRAITQWESAVRIDPRDSVALNHLGNGYLETGEVKKSAGSYARASECDPANAAYHFDFANVAFLFRHELGDGRADDAAVIRRALGHFSEASRLEPLNVDYARAYAETFYSLEPPDWPSALAAWRHFLEITPKKDFAYANLARVHMKLGQKVEARSCLAQIQAGDFDRLKTRLSERIDAE